MQEVEMRTSDLVPYAMNARVHKVSQVAASIKKFGFINPVLIDEQNGIIAGHGRVLAAQSLEITTVPCIRLGHLSEREKRAYIIADNRLADLSRWDDAALRDEVEALLAEGETVLNLFADDWAPTDKVERVEPKDAPVEGRVIVKCAKDDESALRDFLTGELARCPLECSIS